MKKLFAAALAAVMIVMCFAGCGAKNVELSKVLSDINSQFPDATSGLTQLKEKSELNDYYEIDDEDVKQFAAEINTDASTAAVEIVLVEAVDKDAAKDVKECLDERFASITSQYASYSAEQLNMVKKCKVTTSGNFVVMIVADGYDDIAKVVNDAIG